MLALSTRTSLLCDALQVAVVLRFWEEDVLRLWLELSVQGLQSCFLARHEVVFRVLAEAVWLGGLFQQRYERIRELTR